MTLITIAPDYCTVFNASQNPTQRETFYSDFRNRNKLVAQGHTGNCDKTRT